MMMKRRLFLAQAFTLGVAKVVVSISSPFMGFSENWNSAAEAK